MQTKLQLQSELQMQSTFKWTVKFSGSKEQAIEIGRSLLELVVAQSRGPNHMGLSDPDFNDPNKFLLICAGCNFDGRIDYDASAREIAYMGLRPRAGFYTDGYMKKELPKEMARLPAVNEKLVA